jgi:hypothetical protein
MGFDPQAPEADLRGLGGPAVCLGKPLDGDAFLERLAGVLHGSATGTAPRRRAFGALAVVGLRAAPSAL